MIPEKSSLVDATDHYGANSMHLLYPSGKFHSANIKQTAASKNNVEFRIWYNEIYKLAKVCHSKRVGNRQPFLVLRIIKLALASIVLAYSDGSLFRFTAELQSTWLVR